MLKKYFKINLKIIPGEGKSGISLMASDSCLTRSESHIICRVKIKNTSY